MSSLALHDIGIGKDFLNRPPFAQEIRTTTDTWDSIKLNNLVKVKQISRKDFSPAIHLTEDYYPEHMTNSNNRINI